MPAWRVLPPPPPGPQPGALPAELHAVSQRGGSRPRALRERARCSTAELHAVRTPSNTIPTRRAPLLGPTIDLRLSAATGAALAVSNTTRSGPARLLAASPRGLAPLLATNRWDQ